MEDRWIKECLRQAKRAFDAGEVPVGAVVVKDGKVIARAHNRVESLRDPTAHAELLAIKKALKKLNQKYLHGSTSSFGFFCSKPTVWDGDARDLIFEYTLASSCSEPTAWDGDGEDFHFP